MSNVYPWDRSVNMRAQKRGKESEYFGPFKSPSISQSDDFGLPHTNILALSLHRSSILFYICDTTSISTSKIIILNILIYSHQTVSVNISVSHTQCIYIQFLLLYGDILMRFGPLNTSTILAPRSFSLTVRPSICCCLKYSLQLE